MVHQEERTHIVGGAVFLSRGKYAILSLLAFTVLVIIGLSSVDDSSAEPVGTYSGGGITYTLNEEGGVCTASASWDGTSSEVTVEASISQNEKTYIVNELKAFGKNAVVTKVTIKSNDQLTLAKGTLQKNSNLQTIELGEGITNLPQSFAASNTKLTAVNLSNVTTIGASAFGGCTSLVTVDLSNVTTIGASAFNGCKGLTSVNLAKTFDIGKSAFQDCSALQSVSLSQDLEIVGDTAFKSCIKLQSISLPGNILTIGTGMFQGCKELSNIDFDPNFKTIGKSMFEGCTSLTTIDLKNVQSVGISAFRGCTSLTSVTIPSTVKAIGNMAFEGCTLLSSCNLGSNLESLGYLVFKDCPLITGKMVIPATLVSLSLHQTGVPTFPANLSEVEVEEGNALFKSKDGILYDKELKTVLYCPGAKTGEVTISASVGSYAFTGCHLSRIIVLDGATTIGNVAFEADYQNPTLEELVLPESLESIGQNIVAGQTKLKAIILPAELGSLGSIFNGLTGLEYIVFPTTAFVASSANAFNGIILHYSDGTNVPANAANDSISSLQGLRFVWDSTNVGEFYQIADDHVLLTQNVNGDKTYRSISKESPFASPSAPEAPEGLSFVGWFTDSAMTVEHNENNAVTTDLTLYAKFRIDACTVNLKMDDSVKDSISGLAPGSAITLPVVSKDDQNFNGWKVNGILLGAQYIVSVNDADELGVIDLVASFSPIEKTSWNLAVSGEDVAGKVFWTNVNVIGSYGIVTVIPGEFEKATVSVVPAVDGAYIGKLSDNTYLVYSANGGDVTVTVAFQSVEKASEYTVSLVEIAKEGSPGFRATVAATDGGIVDTSGKLSIRYVYKVMDGASGLWCFTTSGQTTGVDDYVVPLGGANDKAYSVTGDFYLNSIEAADGAYLVYGYASYAFGDSSVTAETTVVTSPVIMSVSEIQAVVSKS